MSRLCLVICLTIVYISVSRAQSLCALFEREGECVDASNSCPDGKIESTTFNCGTPMLNCCYTAPVPPRPRQEECGKRSPTRRIFGGTDSGGACRWPWMVSIRVKQSGSVFDKPNLSNTRNLCNGVLIRPNVVLTSANCLHIASLTNGNRPAFGNLLVIAGEYNTDAIEFVNTSIRERFHSVLNTNIHPRNFQPDETRIRASDLTNPLVDREAYNIAVLKLADNVELGNCREIACLPSFSDLVAYDNNNFQQCYMASWGEFDNSNNPSLTLKEAAVDLYPTGLCQYIDVGFRNKGTTCGRVRFNNNGLCQGDDGGMVICKDRATSKWKLFGMVNVPDFQLQCRPSGSSLITFTDIRNRSVVTWVESLLG